MILSEQAETCYVPIGLARGNLMKIKNQCDDENSS